MRAEIELLPSAGLPLATGVRPNHFIRELGYHVIGAVEFEGRHSLGPGEKCTATVRFLGDEPFGQLVRPGFEWEIRSGSRPIGSARVLEVEPDA